MTSENHEHSSGEAQLELVKSHLKQAIVLLDGLGLSIAATHVQWAFDLCSEVNDQSEID
jgi:hypothetical protein